MLAISRYLKGIFLNPQDPNFLHTLTEIQHYRGKKKETIKTLTKTQENDPVFSDQQARWRSQVEG